MKIHTVKISTSCSSRCSFHNQEGAEQAAGAWEEQGCDEIPPDTHINTHTHTHKHTHTPILLLKLQITESFPVIRKLLRNLCKGEQADRASPQTIEIQQGKIS